MIDRLTMQSSFVKQVAFDGPENGSGEMEVIFKNGTMITYVGVPASEYLLFKAAESKGNFYASQVRGKYRVKPDVGNTQKEKA